MKKVLALGVVLVACSLSFSVGQAANIAENKIELNKVAEISDLNTFMNVDLIIVEAPSVEVGAVVEYSGINNTAIAAEPIIFDDLRTGELVAYRMPGQLKNKYHPWYLFHPLKIC